MRDEMREPARILTEILQTTAKHVRPGISTWTLDAIVEQEIKKHGVFSYNKGYHPEWSRNPYPAASCISVNHVLAHGIPSKGIVLKEGDLVNIDIGIIDKQSNCADAAFSVAVGEIDDKDAMLLRYAKKTLLAGIERVKDGVTIGEIALAMERKAGERKFVINHQMCGHGIGKKMHESPTIYHVTNHYYTNAQRYEEYQKYMDTELKEGMVICLEPILTFADKWGQINPQTGWQVYTQDGKKAAMFEHMILVKKDGYEVLTKHFDF